MFRVEDIRAELLPHLVELAADEESSVRLAAFDTIINLMEMMDSGESNNSPPSVISCLKPSVDCMLKSPSPNTDSHFTLLPIR